MNDSFYNGKHTLILPDAKLLTDLEIPDNVDIFIGSLEKVSFDIKKKEINNDIFYDGHLIINKKDVTKNINYKFIFNKNIEDNVIYVKKVIHSGNWTECFINDDIMYCNGFVLPFVANWKRTDNSLYASCWTNRIKIKELWQE